MTDDHADIPTQLKIGETITRTLDGEEIVLIGSAPRGVPVVLSPGDWKKVRRWKLDRLIAFRGRVLGSDGRSLSRPQVVRFLHPQYARNHLLVYRNGNAMDLRRSNLAFIPRGLLAWAKRQAKCPPVPAGVTITSRDGRKRTMRERTKPPAAERVKAIIAGQDCA